MHKMVNGKRVELSPEEEAQVVVNGATNKAAAAEEARLRPVTAPDEPPRNLEVEVADLRARLGKLERSQKVSDVLAL